MQSIQARIEPFLDIDQLVGERIGMLCLAVGGRMLVLEESQRVPFDEYATDVKADVHGSSTGDMRWWFCGRHDEIQVLSMTFLGVPHDPTDCRSL